MSATRGWELKTLAAPALILTLWQRCAVITKAPTSLWRTRSKAIRSTICAREMQRRLHRRPARGEQFVCLDIVPAIAARTKRLAN